MILLVFQEDFVLRQTEVVGDFLFDVLESVAALSKLENGLLLSMFHNIRHIVSKVVEMRADNFFADIVDLLLDHVVNGLLCLLMELLSLVLLLLLFDFGCHVEHALPGAPVVVEVLLSIIHVDLINLFLVLDLVDFRLHLDEAALVLVEGLIFPCKLLRFFFVLLRNFLGFLVDVSQLCLELLDFGFTLSLMRVSLLTHLFE